MARILFSVLALVLVGGCATSNAPPEPQVEGEGMDKEKIRFAIREHIVPIRHCYEKELKTSPRLGGKLVLEWDIEDFGKVTRVVVKKAVHPRLDQCVADVIKATQFPAPPQKGQIGRVIYPFVFSPDPNKAIN